jgi:hypothetical protein
VVLKASAARRQRFSESGIRVRASCRPRCAIRYAVKLTGTSPAASGDEGATQRVGVERPVRVKLFDGTYDPFDSANELVKQALRRNRVVRARLTLTPIDGLGIAQGKSVKLAVRLTR